MSFWVHGGDGIQRILLSEGTAVRGVGSALLRWLLRARSVLYRMTGTF